MASKPSTLSEYSKLQDSSCLFELTETEIFALKGEDRKGWLQGQVTNDLRDLQLGSALDACLCKPTGQLLAFLRIYEGENALYLVTNEPEEIVTRVQEAVIMEDVILEKLEHPILSLQGVAASNVLKEQFPLPTTDVLEDENGILLRHDRTGYGGWDICHKTNLNHPPTNLEVLELAMLEQGTPKFGIETNQKTLPPELGTVFIEKNISYKKGCYTGQEIIHRIYARGRTNKQLVGLFLDHQVNGGATITANSEDIGIVHQCKNSPKFGWIATATIISKFAKPESYVEVSVQQACVTELPFTDLPE